MKLPKHAPKDINRLLTSLCTITNFDCKDLTCKNCIFVTYNIDGKRTNAEMFKQLTEYLKTIS